MEILQLYINLTTALAATNSTNLKIKLVLTQNHLTFPNVTSSEFCLIFSTTNINSDEDLSIFKKNKSFSRSVVVTTYFTKNIWFSASLIFRFHYTGEIGMNRVDQKETS